MPSGFAGQVSYLSTASSTVRPLSAVIQLTRTDGQLQVEISEQEFLEGTGIIDDIKDSEGSVFIHKFGSEGGVRTPSSEVSSHMWIGIRAVALPPLAPWLARTVRRALSGAFLERTISAKGS